MIKRLLLLLTIFLPLAVQAQSPLVTLAGKIQASNGLNAASYTINFTPNQVGFIAGTGVMVNTTTSCGTSSDGTVVGTPNPLFATIVTPQFSGTLPPGNYYVEFAWVTSTGTVTLPSPETPVQLSSTGGLVVAAPASGVPANATGMNVYVGSTSGGETLQGTSSGTGTFTLATPLVSGAAPPTTNNTICQQVANDSIWPVGTGYNVTLVDPSGNTLPGYPMLWQLLGAGTTINLSTGLPYYHGVVTFPSPILASPLNHATQSISGGLNFQGYNITNVGSITACTTNGEIHANCLSAPTDIGAKINAAIAQCGQSCTVTVDAGAYNFTTPIVIPMNSFGSLQLKLDGAAGLIYNGTGCAITSTINTAIPTVVNLRISGGLLFAGTGSPTCGIHVMASNGVWIDGMVISGFAGDGIWVDGANGVWIKDNLIANNQVGVFATNTKCNGTVCSPTGSGTIYTPNAVHVVNNDIPSNSQWGVQFFDQFTNQSEGALNSSIETNDLELNGSAGNQYGAVSVGMSTGMVIEKNYFEGSPSAIQLGIPGGSDGTFRNFASRGPVIRDNYFTLQDNIVPGGTYQINLLDTDNALIEGNASLGASENANSCFINTLARSGSNIGETNTYLGKNAWYSDENTGLGHYTCVGGTAGQLVGTGTFPIINTNYVMTLVNGNYAITSAGTSETVAVGGQVTSASYCTVGPFNATAWNNATSPTINPSSFIPTGNNSGTLYHPSGVNGLRVNIFCVSGPLN